MNYLSIPHLTRHNRPAIRMNRLPTNRTTIIRRQKHKHSRNLTRLRRPSNRRRKLLNRLIIHRRGDQRRPHGPRRNSIHPNAFTHVLVRQATGEGDDGTFGGCVVEQIGAPNVRVDGGVVDDCGAFFHVWERVFAEVEEWVDVGVEGFEPLVSEGVC